MAGFGKVIFVIKKELENEFCDFFIKKLQDKIPVDYVFQEIDRVPDCITQTADRKKPWGTGHAVLMAAQKINEPFAVINADDFYGRNAYQALADFYKKWTPETKEQYCMVGYDIGNTLSEHGAVSRGICVADRKGYLQGITEQTKIERLPEGIAYKDEKGRPVFIPENTIVSMNFWGFTPSFFRFLETGFYNFYLENAKSASAEFYIPTMVNDMINNREATVKILNSGEKWFGMTYREDREQVVRKIRDLVNQGIYPENLRD
jgi:UTP-glucose-1-phosphate uridylyltransferase